MSDDDKNEITGPTVRKLLKEPLPRDHALRYNHHEHTIEFFEKPYAPGGYLCVKHSARLIDRGPKRNEYRHRTAAEIAAEIDDWIRHDREKRKRYAAEQSARETAQKVRLERERAMLHLVGASTSTDEIAIVLGPNLRLHLKPDGENCVWRVAIANHGHLTTEEVKDMLARGGIQ